MVGWFPDNQSGRSGPCHGEAIGTWARSDFGGGCCAAGKSLAARCRDFCAEHGVSEPAFYAWRRTIVARDQQAAESPRPEGKRLPLFVPVRVSLASVAALEIVLRDDRVVRVPAGFDAPLGRRKELPRGGVPILDTPNRIKKQLPRCNRMALVCEYRRTGVSGGGLVGGGISGGAFLGGAFLGGAFLGGHFWGG